MCHSVVAGLVVSGWSTCHASNVWPLRAESKTSEVLIFPDSSEKKNAFLKIIFKLAYCLLVWLETSISPLIFPGRTQKKMPCHSLPQDFVRFERPFVHFLAVHWCSALIWTGERCPTPPTAVLHLRQVRTANTSCLVVQIFTTCQESDTSSSEERSAVKYDDPQTDCTPQWCLIKMCRCSQEHVR